MSSRAPTDAERNAIYRLAYHGAAPQDIAATLTGWTPTAVQHWCRKHGVPVYEQARVVVTRDPSGTFEAGAEFDLTDLKHGAAHGVWQPGTRFLLRIRGCEYRAAVVGGRVVRDDGRWLAVRDGSNARWRSLRDMELEL